jgi:hypothetical protein
MNIASLPQTASQRLMLAQGQRKGSNHGHLGHAHMDPTLSPQRGFSSFVRSQVRLHESGAMSKSIMPTMRPSKCPRISASNLQAMQ